LISDKNHKDNSHLSSRRVRQNVFCALLDLLVLSLLCYSWMFSKISVPNERSRAYLSVAIVDNGSVSIDGPVARFGKLLDIAKYQGRYYTDKAPGSSLLGALVYGSVRIFTDPEDWSIEEIVNLMRTWLMIPIGLAGFFLLRRFIGRLSFSPETADVVSLGWILGASAFHYSTAYYGHQIVAVALLAALAFVEDARAANQRRLYSSALFFAAGASAGLAGLCEYQSAIPCVFLSIYVIAISLKNPVRAAAFFLGAAPFVMLLLGYNRLAFGGIFELSYDHLLSAKVQALHTEGIAGVARPYAEAAFGGLLSLHWGFFPTSPFFILAPIGFVFAVKSKRTSLAVLMGLTLIYYLLLISGAQNWKAGWSFGPRLLVPVMPLAAVLTAFAVDGLRKSWLAAGIGAGLVLIGVLYHQIVHLVFPELPKDILNPLLDVVFPALAQGRVSPNLAAKLFGAQGFSSIIPAMFLIAATCAMILWRGFGAITGALKKGLSSAVAVFFVVVFIVIVYFEGPSWTEASTERFLSNMEKYELQESYHRPSE
jgi:hypothetical protein